MITVHHLNNSRSQRVLWLLEEASVPYEIKRYERDKKTMLAPPELKAIHPLGKSPCISDGPVVVAESGAITEYLVTHHAPMLRPEKEEDRRLYTYWLHYAEGSAMMPLMLSLVFHKIETSPMPFFAKPIAKAIAASVRKDFISPQLKLHFDFMENELSKRAWFAGEKFSAADIMMSFPLEGAHELSILKGRPHLEKFLTTIHARPAYKRGIEKGGEYTLKF